MTWTASEQYNIGMIKKIPGFVGYEISSDGEVFTYWKTHGMSDTPRKLSIARIKHKKSNYIRSCVGLMLNGKQKQYSVSRLVAETFIPNPNKYPIVCHIDNNPSNNNVNNLRWDTQKGNLADRIANGTQPIGSKNPCAKLTEQQVAKIKQLHQTGKYSWRKLGKQFDVSKTLIGFIVKGKNWTHVMPTTSSES